MKCQMCGKCEVNFHYSSNINGCVTETHLCSDCAAKSGYDVGQLLSSGSVFNGFFPLIGGHGGFMPMVMPMMSYDAMSPFEQRPQIAANVQEDSCSCSCGNKTADVPTGELDDEMKMRRELNVQMSIAIENQEFEKAAQLRDKIKELE